MSNDLPLRCQQIFDTLKGRGDVPVHELCQAIDKKSTAFSYDQQFLGSYINRLNRRLKKRGMKVKPGALKGTYRLTVVQ
jgi:hypothetical protein